MQNNYRFTPPMSVKDQNEFKYILDVDGNAWSGRFHRLVLLDLYNRIVELIPIINRLMNSNSVVFKSTIFPEWYSQRLMPWYQ